MEDKIIEVDRERFWDWYLSDREDVLNLGNQLKDHLTNSDEPYQTDAHEILNCGIGYLPLSVCITTEEQILSMGFHIEDDEIEDFDKLRFAKKEDKNSSKESRTWLGENNTFMNREEK